METFPHVAFWLAVRRKPEYIYKLYLHSTVFSVVPQCNFLNSLLFIYSQLAKKEVVKQEWSRRDF